MAETKLEKFQRLFEKRMDKAFDAIRVVGNLNSQNYEIDPVLVAHGVTNFEAQWMDIRVALGLPAVSTTAQAIQDMKDDNSENDEPIKTDHPTGSNGWEMMDKALNALCDGDHEKAKELMLAGFSV